MEGLLIIYFSDFHILLEIGTWTYTCTCSVSGFLSSSRLQFSTFDVNLQKLSSCVLSYQLELFYIVVVVVGNYSFPAIINSLHP